jgi:transposase
LLYEISCQNTSINTVSRVFDIVNYQLYKLPEVIAIDEFKGNAGGEKYQVVITNPKTRKVLDISLHDSAVLFGNFY